MRRRLIALGGMAAIVMAGVLPASVSVVSAQGAGATCRALPSAAQLRQWLVAAPAIAGAPIGGPVGGLFNGARMWAAVVNRAGEICAYVTSTDDPTQVWPGSQAIAKSKAYTANAFSLDDLALSTARLYTFTQPGHSLWSLGQGNPFNPDFLQAPDAQGSRNQIAGGQIFFGGGVPLYSGGQIVGGLGISGDTSCADHEIAKRVRHLALMNPPGGPTVDDIVYAPPDPASVFAHPVCLNTWRNGEFIGNEQPETYPHVP
jgi:uncharacterized protein GlcG (DUF336 family)